MRRSNVTKEAIESIRRATVRNAIAILEETGPVSKATKRAIEAEADRLDVRRAIAKL